MKRFRRRIIFVVAAFCSLLAQSRAVVHLTAPAQGTPLSRSADGASSAPSASADGTRVVFVSDANNFLEGQNNRRFLNVFMFEKATGSIRLVSSGTSGRGGNGNSSNATISSDGRWIVFESDASNLVSADVNGKRDIFLYDVEAGAVRNLTAAGNGDSRRPMMNDNGNRIAFESLASNLANATDENNAGDVFLVERDSGAISLVSVNAAGSAAALGPSSPAAISSDGARILFYSRAGDLRAPSIATTAQQVWLRNHVEGTTILVSEGQGTAGTIESRGASMNSDGGVVAFVAHQRLADGTATGPRSNVFVRVFPETELRQAIPNSPNLMNATVTATSPDGSRVAFTDARTLHLFSVEPGTRATVAIGDVTTSYSPPVRFALGGASLLVGHGIPGAEVAAPWDSVNVRLVPSEAGFASSSDAAAIYFDSSIAFDPQDLNRASDIYELAAGGPSLVSAVAIELNRKPPPVMSVHRLPEITPRTLRLPFNSYSDAIVAGDSNGYSDVFVARPGLGNTVLGSGPALEGAQANGHSFAPGLSPDGRYLAFASFASNLVPDDGNRLEDVFLKDLETGAIELVTVPVRTVARNYSINTHHTLVSEGGRYVAFSAYRLDIIPTGTPSRAVVFVRDRQNGTTRWIHSNLASSSGYPVGLFGDTLWLVVMPSASTRDLYRYSLSTATLTRVNSITGDPAIRFDGSVAFAQRVLSGRSYLYSVTPEGVIQELGDFPGAAGAVGARAALSVDFNGNLAFLSAGQIVPEDADTQPDIYWATLGNPASVRLASGGFPRDRADTWVAGWPIAIHASPSILYRATLTRATDFVQRSDLYFSRMPGGDNLPMTMTDNGPQMVTSALFVAGGLAFISDGWGLADGPMAYRPEIVYEPFFYQVARTSPEIEHFPEFVRISWNSAWISLQASDDLQTGEWRAVNPSGSQTDRLWYNEETAGRRQRFFRLIYPR